MKNNFSKISIIFSILLFGFFCFAFSYVYGTISNNNEKAQKDEAAWAKEASRRDDLRSLDRSIQIIAPDQAILETHFASTSDVVPFLDTLEKLAPAAGATAAVSSVETLPDNGGLIVGLIAAGTFQSVYKFITLLESSPYMLDFLSMDLHNAAANTTVQGKVITSSEWEAVFKIKLLTFVP